MYEHALEKVNRAPENENEFINIKLINHTYEKYAGVKENKKNHIESSRSIQGGEWTNPGVDS